MINVSNAFRQEVANDRRNYEMTVNITLSDDTRLTLTNANIIASGFSMEDAVCTDNAFQALGGCVINSATLIINNRDDAFSAYDFQNATVIIYLSLLNERIKKGTFRVDKTSYNGFSITLTLLDYMENFDRPYSTSSLTYPATLDDIVRDACTHCGVTLHTLNFPHKSFVIASAPTAESTTFRDVISWVAAIVGCFARCNVDGKLELKWFDTATIDTFFEGLNGGHFDSSTPYASGDSADGGTFDPWNTGDVVDGGQFGSELPLHYLTSLYSQTVAVEDTVITGVQITVKSDVDSQTVTNKYMSGQAGYVLSIDNNGLITDDNAQEIVTWLGAQLIGLRFRQLTITHTNDPTIEAGDVGVVFDRKGNEYVILITRTAFRVFGKQTTVCASETPSKNTATRYSEATKAYVESRKLLKETRTTFEERQAELAEQIENAGGLYKTEIVEQGATKIYYHNKPELSDSDIIMLFSDVGFTLSADGGTTWYGMTVDGTLISSILNTIGINADWINTGELVISKTEGGVTKEMLYANVDTGIVRIVADSFSLSTGDTIQSIANAAVNPVKQHFWFDSTGAHISTTADDGNTNYNSVWNSSSGLLFRKDENNLVQFALDGITFYDGTGNTAGAKLAKFGTTGIYIGRGDNNTFNITPQNVTCKNKNGTTLFELHTALGIKDIEEMIETFSDPTYYIDVQGGTSNDTATLTLPNDILLAEYASISIQYGRTYGGQGKTVNTYAFQFTPGTASDYVYVCDTYQRIWFTYDGNRTLIIHVYNVDGYESGTLTYYFELIELTYDISERYPAFTLGTRSGSGVGAYSFRAGENNSANGYAALAFGGDNSASADYSCAGGQDSRTLGQFSFAYGQGAKTGNIDGGFACGNFNVPSATTLFGVGNGFDDNDRSDAFWINEDGDVGITGALYSGQSSTASRIKLFTTGSATEDNISITAGQNSGAIIVDLSKTNYTPLALRGIRINNATTNGANAATCAVYSARISGDDLICNIYNHGSNDATVKVIADILYIAETAL